MKMLLIIVAMLFLAASVSVADDEYIEKPVWPNELYELIESADRVVVTERTWDDEGYQAADKILYESRDRKDLTALRESLEIQIPEISFHCACLGTPVIHLYLGENELVSFTNHHGISVRTPLWSSDARVGDVDKWVSWFADRGIMGPHQDVEESRIRAERNNKDKERWMAAMPTSIKPLWEKSMDMFGQVNTKPLKDALNREIHNQEQQILVLLEWYGSGAGPWSGFPSYEAAAEEMLQDYKTGDIVNAIESNELSLAKKEGAARFFADNKRRSELYILPDVLKKELLDHIMESDNEDNKARARYAFEQVY